MRFVKDIFKILDRKQRKLLLQGMFLDILVSVLDILFLAVLLVVINFFSGQSSDFKFISLFRHQPLLLIGVFLIIFCLKNLFAVKVIQLQSDFIFGVASGLSMQTLQNYLQGNYSDYVNIDSSEHTRRINQQPLEFCIYILGGLQQIVSQGILILVAFASIIAFKPILFALLFVILFPPVALVAYIQKKKLDKIKQIGNVKRQKAMQYLNEALAGFVESNIFQRRQFFAQRFYAQHSQYSNFLARQQVMQMLPSRVIEVFAVFGLFALIVISQLSGQSILQLVTLGAFMAAAYKIIPGIVKILNAIAQIKTYEFTVDDLVKEKQKQISVFSEHRSIIRSVEFKDVSFSYKNKLVLENFSCHFSSGDFVGISGVSGRGKTTIVHLMLGFLKPDKGSILVNGEHSTELQRQSYWNRVSYLKQQPFFIHDTAIKNVVLDDGDYDEDRFVHASEMSGFKTIVNGDASKLVTENGKNISGGQRQRIAFARALFKDCDLLILDEPFSEMDEAAEKEMIARLKQIAKQGKIVVLITHNTDCLKDCTTIIELTNSF